MGHNNGGMDKLSSANRPPLRPLADVLPSLQQLVEDLTATNEFALARIWLIDTGDLCGSCSLRSQCADQRACLHLIASAGQSRKVENPERWNRLDGSFRRLPLHVQKIGRIGATGEPLVIRKLGNDGGALLHRDWAAAEGIRGFFGYPLQSDGKVSGVIAVFTRVPLTEAMSTMLRTVARVAEDLIARGARQSQLQLEIQLLELDREEPPPLVSVRSTLVRRLNAQIQLAAQFDGPVLIIGETGTDRRGIARRVHDGSSFSQGGLMPVDATAFCEQILKTGPSLMGRLPPGTLLLENIERLHPEQRQHLAELLEQMGELHRTSRQTRILASTVMNFPVTEAEVGSLDDLDCALSVITIDVPPLRRRREDLPKIIIQYLRRIQTRYGKPTLSLAPEELRRMQQFPWPGNDRELELALERAVFSLPAGETVLRHVLEIAPSSPLDLSEVNVVNETRMRQLQRANLIACLKECGWKIYGSDGAASRLGIKPTTLVSRMKKFGIVKPEQRSR